MRTLVMIALALALAPLSTEARRRKPKAPAPVDAPAAPVDPAKDALARIQKFYESTTDLHAKFEQTLEAGYGGKKKAAGELWLKKPGRMRWEYVKPDKKLMVSDGTTLWVYEPEDEQAFRQELKSTALPSSVTFLTGSGRLSDEFNASLEKSEGPDVVLKLVPKQPTAQYRHLVFVVDGKTWQVKETVVHDQQGGTNRIAFRDVETNKGVADGKFTFSPPAGTRIIRP